MAIAIPTGTTRDGAARIPQIFHRIWLGGAMSEEHEEFGRTWQRHHPQWEIKLWTDENLPPLRNQAAFDTATSAAQRADIARYELLVGFGGVYLDCDFECLRPIDALLDGVEGFAAFEDHEWVAIGIMGCVPGHPFFNAVVEELPRSIGARPGQPPNDQTGPRFFTPLATAHAERDPRFRLFEPALFYPYLYDEPHRRHERFPDAYAAHHWMHSWREPAPVGGATARFVVGISFADPTACLPALAAYARLFTPRDDVELCLLVHGTLPPEAGEVLQRLVAEATPDAELPLVVACAPDELTGEGVRAAFVPSGERAADARALAAFLATLHDAASALRAGAPLPAFEGAPTGWDAAPAGSSVPAPVPVSAPPAAPAPTPAPASYGTYVGNDRILVRTTWNGRLLTFADDLGLTPDLVTEGEYDPAFTRWLQRNVRAGQVVWDVGANIGYFTLLMAQLVGEHGRVVAWEASPSTHALLLENLTMAYLLDRVEARAVAVAEAPGSREFHHMRRFVGCGSLRAPDATHYARFPVDSAEVLHVPAEPLDAHFDAVTRVDLVKIDVEGAELGVLRGMRRLLEADRVGVVAFELVREALGAEFAPLAALLRELADAGYRFGYPTADGAECAIDVERVLDVAAFPQVLMRRG